MKTIDQWESEAKADLKHMDFPAAERILALIDLVRKKDDSMKWIMPKVHQWNHEGEFEICEKATCVEYRKALALTEQLK